MKALSNQVVVITGASSGIGEAVARHLAALGAKVVLAARRADRLKKLATDIGDNAIWKTTDVTKKADLEALAQYAIDTFGGIDVLINNAGIMPISFLAADMVDDWERMVDINIKGVLFGIHAVLGHMLAKGDGSIINIASTAAHSVGPGGAVYSATKSAVRNISEGLRQEVSGVLRVCTICPGFTQSELAESVNDENVKPMVAKLFEEKAMPASAIAEAVAYVLSQPKAVAVNEMTVRPLAGQSS
jgi:NADP-dependent 3-hydroxy acid dehydrogenase YdfG